MGKNIALIVFTCVVALLGILINPKQDADKRFFKPTPVLAPQIAGHNLKNKLGLIKFGNYDNRKKKIYT